jgi:Lrp/AsnC family leucine-responsive transcriptional regulator
MDTTDSKLIALLARDGRAQWADLAKLLRMSAPAVRQRVKRLEAAGFITGYAALLAPGRLGLAITAFLAVSLDHPRHRAAFLKRASELAEVLECHHVAGDDDYLLKVRCRGTAELEDLVSVRIKGLAGVARSRTTIVLSTVKETPVPPLPVATKPAARRR